MVPEKLAPIFWHVDGFSCGPFNFILEVTGIKDKQAKYPEFILMKSRPLVLDYIENLKNVEVSNILELGIMKGGSCAMFEALYRPSCHMAIDVYKHDDDGLAELEKYVASFKRQFKAHYGVSQADIPRIMSEWNSLTGQKSFDIIIDDASHSYSLSMASFNGLFPHLRPGGVYVIEDWGWAHWNGPWQDTTHPEFNSPALSNLSIHCVLRTTALAQASDRYHPIISKVISTADQTVVFRGDAPISETFDVRQNVPMRGREPFLL